MDRYRINWFRLIVAAAFFVEIGLYFGIGHVLDQSPVEVVASGISFLLFSLSVKRAS